MTTAPHSPPLAVPRAAGLRRTRRVLLSLGAVVALVAGGASAGTDHDGRHRAISTPDAPAAIGPYSQGVSAGHLVFVSGQLPIDPATGEIPSDATIEEQTRRAVRSVQAVLKADRPALKHV
ncbi:Rid family hydrolase [Streptomyces sp. NPDC032940]|uniref:Rid family hydrolase n=1 Tax=Streptomyces sp. NPDC032940 TaxID=3155366 RepID=UPI0033FC034F